MYYIILEISNIIQIGLSLNDLFFGKFDEL